MQVSQIMSTSVEVIPSEATIQDAAERMRERGIGSLPVRDGSRLLGMITDRDIAIRAVAQNRDGSTPVREAMTPGVVFCYSDDDVRRVAEIMEDKQIRRLPVLSREKQLLGIVSLGDIAVRVADLMLSGEALERVSEASHLPQ